jgi:hypothetical protein
MRIRPEYKYSSPVDPSHGLTTYHSRLDFVRPLYRSRRQKKSIHPSVSLVYVATPIILWLNCVIIDCSMTATIGTYLLFLFNLQALLNIIMPCYARSL